MRKWSVREVQRATYPKPIYAVTDNDETSHRGWIAECYEKADAEMLVSLLNEKEAREAPLKECERCGHSKNGHVGRPKGCDYIVEDARCGCVRFKAVA